MSEGERGLRRRLRAHGRQLGDRGDRATGVQEIDRLVHEVAYEHWHRMLFARFLLAENELLIEPESGVAVSLAECEELARERNEDSWTLAGRFAQRMLPRIFRWDDPALNVALAPETQQALERLLESLPAEVFTAGDSLGWTYQFWQAERKDAVNASGVKIGADELPAVTSLFTERYMVLFLFHNTIGAWWAGRLLSERPELFETAAGEEELRQAMRIEALGGYDFSYLRFARQVREGEAEDDPTGPWRPAASVFDGWPRTVAELRVLDPCCGSGHFLLEGFELLVRLRMEEEGLTAEDAIRAVLRDNLFGLEIDPRCTQIAAFNLAFAAWKLADRPIELPPLNVACSGLAPHATKDEWIALAEQSVTAGGMPSAHGPCSAEDTPLAEPLRNSLTALHDFFEQAPELGSLIDPRGLEDDLLRADFAAVEPLLAAALKRERNDEEQVERAVAAQGMARAAELLAGNYTLVITNVPYLGRGKQSDALKIFADAWHKEAKNDLATMFVARIFGWLDEHSTQAVVTPQSWHFLPRYKKLREKLLRGRIWNLVARLGPGAFETIGGHVVNVSLNVLSEGRPERDWQMAGIDVSNPRDQRPIPTQEKDVVLRNQRILALVQAGQLAHPDYRILFSEMKPFPLLSTRTTSRTGTRTADNPCLLLNFWEVPALASSWRPCQSTVKATKLWDGCEGAIRWESSRGLLHELDSLGIASIQGEDAWGKSGILVSLMSELPVTLYTGEIFDMNSGVLNPIDSKDIGPVWAFLSSDDYHREVRLIDQQLKLTTATLLKVPFDLPHWQSIAAKSYPNSLPEPYSDDPTQWIFHGHPCGSVVWDDETKWIVHGPLRVDANVLQVAVARLLGYRWPAERDPERRLSAEARTWVERCADLHEFADADGIVCLPALCGETSAANRLRRLLAAAYGSEWSAATERGLLAAAAGDGRPAASLDDWLRDRFFAEHCKLFHHRPFIWHLWDGRKDGFHALVSYHRLAGPDGEGRRTLEALAYSYLGDWIGRQRAAQCEGEEGADGRLAAAHNLQVQIEKILAGEPPCDLFVRWKPLHRQPIGWQPDIDDGVRLNIRPFMSVELRQGGRKGAGLLRYKPGIKWSKDLGKEPLKPGKRWRPPLSQDEDRKSDVDEAFELRPRNDYPWFWGCPGEGAYADRTDFPGGPDFDGNRWNDLHYTNAVKRATRERNTAEP